jgi:integrase
MVYGPYPPSPGRSRWRLQVYDPVSKKKRSITAPSKAAALALLPLVKVQLREAAPVYLHDAITQYLEHKAPQVAAGWLQTLEDRLRAFLPNVPIVEIDASRAEEIYLQETRRVGRFGIVKAATHQALLRNTKELFRWLCKKGIAQANPFVNVDPIGKAHAGKDQPRETDAKILDAFLFKRAQAQEEGALALLVQIYLGMRSSEVLALTVGAVERNGQRISILRGKSHNARRSLELYSEVALLLQSHCAGRPNQERVFAANLAQRPASSWMYKRLRQYCAAAGIPMYCPHSLRGLHASLALEHGATSHQVAAALGHGSFATTAKHYAQPSSIENARAKRVVAALKGSPDSLESEVKNLAPKERAQLLALLQSK